MNRVLVATIMVVLVGGAACGSDGKEDEAVRIGVERVGDCLSKAGWDADVEHIVSTPSGVDDTYRVSFQNMNDADAFVRVAVNVKTREVLAYDDKDEAVLSAATCSLKDRSTAVTQDAQGGPVECVPGEVCKISRAQFGEEWPFTVESGVLACSLVEGRPDVGKVVFGVDANTFYAINGIAKGFAEEQGWHPLEEIWADNPDTAQYGGKIGIQPMIDLGLSICP